MDLKSTYSVFKFCLKWKEIFISLKFNNIITNQMYEIKGVEYYLKNKTNKYTLQVYYKIKDIILKSKNKKTTMLYLLALFVDTSKMI